MKKTTKKALSLALSIVMTFALTMVFAGAITTYAALNLEGAKEIALNDAGFSESQVVFTQTRTEHKDFDVEFLADGAKYDYEISPEGKILSLSYESNTKVSGISTINATEAQEAAFGFVGADVADIESLICEYDEDDGEYELSFVCGDKSYDITVSAADGTVIEYDFDLIPPSKGIFALISDFFTKTASFFMRIVSFFKGLFS